MPLLDLTEREDFAPIPAGRYRMVVEDAELRQTSGNGKLPEGWTLIWQKLKVVEPLFDPVDDEGKPVDTIGRTVTNQTTVPQKELDDGTPYEKYKMMNGILFRVLQAYGYSKEEMEAGEFELDENDLKGREVIATIARGSFKDADTGEDIYKNDVKGLKPVGDSASSGIV